MGNEISKKNNVKKANLNLIVKKIEKIDKNSKIDYKNVDKNFQNYLY